MKKLLFLILSVCSIVGLAQQKTDAALITNANTVINATAGQNTASRIGNDFLDLANSKRSVIPLSASGTNTYIAASAVVTSYSNGIFDIQFQSGNSGASTLNINSLGAINLQKLVSGSYTALVSGDIQNNQLLKVWYDQPNNTFQVFLGGGGTSISYGTGVQTALGVNIGSAGSVVVNGGAGGTPSSLTATNVTGLPLSTGITGFGSGWVSPLGTALGSGWAAAFAATYSAGGSNPFADNTAILKNNSDNTKLLKFDLSGITTSTTRTLTAPNFDGTIATLAGTETLTNKTLTNAVLGSSTATTQSAVDNSTKIATTAYVDQYYKNQSVSISTATFTLDFASTYQSIFYNTTAITANFIVALSNATNALSFEFKFKLNGSNLTMTCPATFTSLTSDTNWNTATQVYTFNGTLTNVFYNVVATYNTGRSKWEMVVSQADFN